MTPAQLEQTLNMWAWGNWAKPRIDREIGYKSPGWAKEVKCGYRETRYIDPITDEYAEKLDGMIAQLPERTKRILICIYCYGLPLAKVQNTLRIRKHEVVSVRDAALNMLYGGLAFSGCPSIMSDMIAESIR